MKKLTLKLIALAVIATGCGETTSPLSPTVHHSAQRSAWHPTASMSTSSVMWKLRNGANGELLQASRNADSVIERYRSTCSFGPQVVSMEASAEHAQDFQELLLDALGRIQGFREQIEAGFGMSFRRYLDGLVADGIQEPERILVSEGYAALEYESLLETIVRDYQEVAMDWDTIMQEVEWIIDQFILYQDPTSVASAVITSVVSEDNRMGDHDNDGTENASDPQYAGKLYDLGPFSVFATEGGGRKLSLRNFFTGSGGTDDSQKKWPGGWGNDDCDDDDCDDGGDANCFPPIILEEMSAIPEIYMYYDYNKHHYALQYHQPTIVR